VQAWFDAQEGIEPAKPPAAPPPATATADEPRVAAVGTH
jgi:hypothetical protein